MKVEGWTVRPTSLPVRGGLRMTLPDGSIMRRRYAHGHVFVKYFAPVWYRRTMRGIMREQNRILL